MKFDRFFRLSERRGEGVFCGKEGLFVGDTPSLEEIRGVCSRIEWRVREQFDLDRELSKSYGVSVDCSARMRGAGTVAYALSHGDLALAQIATLLLRFPDPPISTNGEMTTDKLVELVRQMRASDLIKFDWDPAKHPRWPAGSPGSVGGEFAPVDGGGATVIPAQITIPLDIPAPAPLPLPFEIVPPLVTPLPRSLPQNPYPSRRECVKQWNDAYKFCCGLKSSGQLGRGDYRGMGRTLRDCILGQVSESCVGNAALA